MRPSIKIINEERVKDRSNRIMTNRSPTMKPRVTAEAGRPVLVAVTVTVATMSGMSLCLFGFTRGSSMTFGSESDMKDAFKAPFVQATKYGDHYQNPDSSEFTSLTNLLDSWENVTNLDHFEIFSKNRNVWKDFESMRKFKMSETIIDIMNLMIDADVRCHM
jgi:hypothetical protein